MKKRLALAAMTAMIVACSGGEDMPTGPSRVTENFSGSLDDPTRCTCNNGVTNGIGYQLRYAQDRFSFAEMWAWIVLLGVLGYAFNTLLLAIERRVLSWQPR